MEEIQIGDIVICTTLDDLSTTVKGNLPPLKLYGEYVVNDIYSCSCGSNGFDVGLVSTNLLPTLCVCNHAIPDTTVHWCDSRRFIKKQSEKLLQLQINAAVKAEDYRLAQVLTNKLEEYKSSKERLIKKRDLLLVYRRSLNFHLLEKRVHKVKEKYFNNQVD